MHNEEIRNLAEKVAQLVSTESRKSDLSALFASIEKINHRLDKLEQSLPAPAAAHALHASAERFDVGEAFSEAAGTQKEKACTFEPNGKPCDHCSMCSSRGF